ncbi:efflux RND transporter periplasmic adaptor subunit [Rickettsia conorii]|uniref:efflux RND transporter periplasmic adaptor subunit n=1 Tax=Rickettsia conorii TaxID=781 RepID=UPI0003182241|nr:efflux RND transporter periplasmic adaptor subunit [Rickettsia conorii]
MDIGDLVSPDFVRLVTINTSSPIYVSFSIPEKYLDRINKSQKSNDLALTVRTVSDQEIKDGEIVFVDNSIDPNSGTIKVKATLPNQNEILWPGQCVRVSPTIYIEQAALIVPSKAMQTNDQGPYIFVVDQDNKAVVKHIDIVFSNDDFIVIKSGIDEGETVITNGQL